MKLLFIFLFIISSVLSYSQSKWKRSEPVLENKQTIFKSTQTFNLPTAEVVPKGDLVYGISHRFSGPISGGYSTFFGLDNAVLASRTYILPHSVLDGKTNTSSYATSPYKPGTACCYDHSHEQHYHLQPAGRGRDSRLERRYPGVSFLADLLRTADWRGGECQLPARGERVAECDERGAGGAGHPGD